MKPTECHQCQGSGGKWIERPRLFRPPDAPSDPKWLACEYCRGTGTIDESQGEFVGANFDVRVPSPIFEEE